MTSRRRREDWIDEDEYPDDKDIEDFGDESPFDNDPRTIGFIRGQQPSFWTKGRVLLLIIVLLLVAALLLPLLLALR